jgi:hypothetical protein
MYLRKFITIGAVVCAAILSLSATAAARTDATPLPTASISGSVPASPTSSPTLHPTISPTYVPPRTLPPGSIRVVPSTAPQGGKVQVFMACFGYAYSTAFGKAWPSSGDEVFFATVYRDARVGRHEVVMLCATGAVGPPAILTVTKAQTQKVPHGGVDTGGGGAADQVGGQAP